MSSTTRGPPSPADVGPVRQPAALSSEESSGAAGPAQTASPALSGSYGVPDLTRTGSTPSVDQASLRSHTSIPVVGTFPLGSLKVHQIMDSPRPQRAEPPKLDDPQMPPLEDARGTKRGGAEPLPRGDIFLVLDLPPNSTVGCDAKAIGTGAKGFKGICDIAPGPHFIWVSEPSAMSRCGFWFVTKDPGQVRVKQWDTFNEVLVDPASNFEVRDQKNNVANLYPRLVPYGFNGEPADSSGAGTAAAAPKADLGQEDAARLWQQLTTFIGEELLMRITGKAGVGEWLVDTSDSAVGDSNFPQAKTTQTYQTLAGTGELSFLFPETDVDLYAARQAPGAVPDTSQDIVRLIDTPGTGIAAADLVGELQFTFLTGLHLSNLSCIEQWWHLVLKVFLRAHELLRLRPALALSFLATFRAQLVYDEKYIASDPSAEFEDDAPRREYGGPAGTGGPTSVLDVVPGNRRKLREALTLYKRRMDEILLDLPPEQQGGAGAMGEVGQAFVELEAWFWRLGWDLRTRKKGPGADDGDSGMGAEDDDEDRPVIVDLDGDGREVGLVSFS